MLKNPSIESEEDEIAARQLVEGAPTAILVLEPHTLRIVDVNRAAASCFGATPAELLGTLLLDHVAPSEREVLANKFELTSSETGVTGTVHAVRSDESRFTLGFQLTSLTPHGQRRILLMGRDLSDVQRAEALYKQLFERSAESILVFNATTRSIINCNPALERLLGRSREAMLAISPLELIAPADRAKVEQTLISTQASPEGNQIETDAVWFRADGAKLFISMRSGVFHIGGEQVLMAFLHDRTAEKTAEERYKQMFLKGRDAILIMDPSLTAVLDANPAFETLSGFSIGELRRTPAVFSLEEFDAAASERWGSLLASDGTPEKLQLLRTKSGDQKPVSVDRSTLETPEGLATTFSLRDVAIELRATEMERSLNQVQKIESLGQMASGIAHDFNNTLMAALPWADLIKRKYKDDPAVQNAADQIRQAVYRAGDVTRQLLDFSQPKKPQRREVSLAEMIESQLAVIRPAIPPEIEIRTELAAGTPPVDADPSQIWQVLLNLALNARDAMPDGGTLTIAARPASPAEESRWGLEPGRHAVLLVRDSGVGMSESILARVFDPFFTTKEIGKGTGLGLSVVHRIAEQHGGVVRAISQPSKGSTFSLFLPIAHSELEAPVMTKEPEANLDGLSILIVDDEPAVAEGIKVLLEMAGAFVEMTDRGPKAIHLIENGVRPDLVILDLGLPDMRGEKVHEELRKLLPDLAILISSGYGDRERIDPLLKSPRTGFLQKPYEMEDLLATVVSLTRKRPLAL